jgi:hypothetical protein
MSIKYWPGRAARTAPALTPRDSAERAREDRTHNVLVLTRDRRAGVIHETGRTAVPRLDPHGGGVCAQAEGAAPEGSAFARDARGVHWEERVRA